MDYYVATEEGREYVKRRMADQKSITDQKEVDVILLVLGADTAKDAASLQNDFYYKLPNKDKLYSRSRFREALRGAFEEGYIEFAEGTK